MGVYQNRTAPAKRPGTGIIITAACTASGANQKGSAEIMTTPTKYRHPQAGPSAKKVSGISSSTAFLASLMLSACGGGGGGTLATPAPTPIESTAFTNWRTDVAGKTIKADGVGKQVAYTWNGTRISAITAIDEATASATFFFDATGELTGLIIDSRTDTAISTSTGFAGSQIKVLARDSDFMTAASASSQAVFSSPTSLAWDYQSFGMWETGLNTTNRTVGVFSVGNSTGTAIPVNGEATFTGKVVGNYIDALGQGNTVLADLNVGVDWGAKSLSFTTTNTKISSNPTTVAFSLTPSLDMTNQLIYSGTANGFSGTLTTEGGLSGDTTGQFYGPTAQELGGVFVLSSSTSVETYSGAYGAVQSPAP